MTAKQAIALVEDKAEDALTALDAMNYGLEPGNRVRFKIMGVSQQDFCMSDDEWEKVIDHDRCMATITGRDCEGPSPEDSYYGIKFDDGFTMDAVSTHHLSRATLREDNAEDALDAFDASKDIQVGAGLKQ